MPHSTYHNGRPILNHRHSSMHARHIAHQIVSRSSETTTDLPPDSDGLDGSDNMINLLLLVLGLVFLALILLSTLFLVRRYRQQQRLRSKEVLPSYNDSEKPRGPPQGLTIETKHDGRSSTIYISRDGAPMLSNPNSPPHSPDNVPEIHITFPDEQDDEGKSKSGRVLVVRVGDNATVGLEPMQEEQLPAYEKEAKGDFYSVDMDHIGGLKEKQYQ